MKHIVDGIIVIWILIEVMKLFEITCYIHFATFLFILS
jgi:hypothetical protein